MFVGFLYSTYFDILDVLWVISGAGENVGRVAYLGQALSLGVRIRDRATVNMFSNEIQRKKVSTTCKTL